MERRKPRRRRKYPSAHKKFLDQHRHLYEQLLEEAGGGCSICGRPPKGRKLDLDHDHRQMKMRSVLCVRCNRAIPSWMDSEWCDKAAAYLRRYE